MDKKENKTKTTSKTVTIIILIILLLAALCFIGYDKFLANEKISSPSEENERKEEIMDNTIKKLTKDSQEIKDLMNTYIEFYNCDDANYLLKLNEISAKLYMAYTRAHHVQNISCSEVGNLIYNNSYTCGDLGEDADSYFDSSGHLITNQSLNETLKYKSVNIVNKSEFDKKIKELFGEDINYSYDDITIHSGCGLVHYDQSIKSYVEYTGWFCGGTCPKITTSLKNISQKGNNLTITADIFKDDEMTETLSYNFKLENDHYVFINME